MKKIIRLARLDLAVLFYSPIAWLMLVIFIIYGGIAFAEQMYKYQGAQHMGFDQIFLTNSIFTTGDGGLLPVIQSKLYFFIPLLTMGLLSREISSGSFKLLLSSPVRISEIVLGKFVSMMVFGLLFILVIVIYIIAGAFSIRVLDLGHLVCGLIGLYLLTCTYAAIGLFMSSLTSYQIVAAILTLTVFAALDYVGTVWQNYDFIRDITYNLSIAGRVDYLIGGLMTSREVIYFLLIIMLFLGLTMLRFLSKRQSTPFSIRWLRYMGLIAGVVIIGYVSSRPKLVAYWDMTANKHETITETSQQMLGTLKEPLEVTTYVNIFDREFGDFQPAVRNKDLRRLERYQRFHRNMKINYVYYYDSSSAGDVLRFNPDKNLDTIARKVIEAYKLPANIILKPSDIRKRIQLLPQEDHRIVRELKLGDKKELIRGTYDDFEKYAGETEVMAAVRRLTEGAAEILFVTGHTEKDIYKAGEREYQGLALAPRLRKSFINQGIKSDSICLKYREVPTGIAALIIADPKLDYDSIEIGRLKRYIDNGGNLLFLGELRKRKLVNQLIEPLGLEFKDSSVLQYWKDYPGDLIWANLMVRPGQNKDSVQPVGKIAFSGVAAIATKGKALDFNVTTVVETDSATTWLRPGFTDVTDSSGVVFNPALGDVKKNVPLMVQSTRKINNKEQRIMVIGDADVFANRGPDLDFALEIIRWFTRGKYPVTIGLPPFKDTKIVVNSRGIDIMKWIFVGVVPAILALTGTIILIRRKRK